jgi:predicted dehydrogenase
MDKKNIRTGIIGSGFAARFHYNALQRVFSTKIEIKGVCSIDRVELEDYCSSRNLKSYINIDELIEQCDLIHVCTPPSSHESIVIAALNKGKHVIVEKPFTGYFGTGKNDFNGDTFSREEGLEQTLASIKRILKAEKESEGRIMYAENWIYAPAIQKEREILEKTGAQILWMHGEMSHTGNGNIPAEAH